MKWLITYNLPIAFGQFFGNIYWRWLIWCKSNHDDYGQCYVQDLNLSYSDSGCINNWFRSSLWSVRPWEASNAPTALTVSEWRCGRWHSSGGREVKRPEPSCHCRCRCRCRCHCPRRRRQRPRWVVSLVVCHRLATAVSTVTPIVPVRLTPPTPSNVNGIHPDLGYPYFHCKLNSHSIIGLVAVDDLLFVWKVNKHWVLLYWRSVSWNSNCSTVDVISRYFNQASNQNVVT